MKTLRLRRWLATLALLSTLVGAQPASAESAREVALRAAIEAHEERVVQLRYFGDAGGTLGTAAPTVTGYTLGERWVLTSLYALAEDPAAILCQRPGADPVEARVVGRDHSRGLALLSLAGGASGRPSIEGRPPRVGETALTIGRVYETDQVHATFGVVSAVGRLGGRAIQTDAAISPVNYGGPLVGIDGAFLGLITPLAPPGQSGVGLYDSGVGFAVPAGQIAPRLQRLSRGEDLRPGWLGGAITEDDPLRSPAKLVKLADAGPASQAGLVPGDLIRSLAEQPTPTAWAFRRRLSGLDAGQRVVIEVLRNGEALEPIVATLAEPPERSESTAEQVLGALKLEGARKNRPDQP